MQDKTYYCIGRHIKALHETITTLRGTLPRMRGLTIQSTTMAPTPYGARAPPPLLQMAGHGAP